MLTHFVKFQGTGNDFVMIDDRDERFEATPEKVSDLCHRRFGIGADGLILLRMDHSVPRMVYFNSDGRPSTMCGNGGRCFVAFCHSLGILDTKGEFLAVDGLHRFIIDKDIVSLRMQDVDSLSDHGRDVVLDTGSPHFVRFAASVESLDVRSLGREIRYSPKYAEEGINVNFVEDLGHAIRVRTYERGVEDETLSCGTGVTAAVLAYDHTVNSRRQRLDVKTLGGDLAVSFQRGANGGYHDVWLHGPAVRVFEGSIDA